MFDFVRTHSRLVLGIMVLLIFPSFIFFGIQGYTRFTGGDNATVAKVDGRNITKAEWDVAQRDQVERVRRQMPGVDPKFFDTPEMRLRFISIDEPAASPLSAARAHGASDPGVGRGIGGN